VEDKNVTPYAQMLAIQLRPEAQATFDYEYRRYAKDPTLALALTIVLGVVGGESYYLGNYMRGILMSLALLTGVGLFVTVPMWICRCFTISGDSDTYNDYLAYSLALRYWPYGASNDRPTVEPPAPPQPTGARRDIAGVPMPVQR
jgi:hypothetical protein